MSDSTWSALRDYGGGSNWGLLKVHSSACVFTHVNFSMDVGVVMAGPSIYAMAYMEDSLIEPYSALVYIHCRSRTVICVL